MSKAKVYQYKKCSTCVKALKFLGQKNIRASIVDITETPPSKTELKLMLAQYNGDIRKLFNTSGLLYRSMNIKDKLPDMTESEAIELLSKNGKLIKRPFALFGKKGVVGFKQDEWTNLI